MPTSNQASATQPARTRSSSPYERREAAVAAFSASRIRVEAVLSTYRERGVEPREIPGLGRMLAGCRQARDVVRVIDLELADA